MTVVKARRAPVSRRALAVAMSGLGAAATIALPSALPLATASAVAPGQLPIESYAWRILPTEPPLSGNPIGPDSPETEIRGLQQRLAWTGLSVEVTGAWDEGTTAGLKRFQAKQRFSPAPVASQKVVARLIEVAGDGSLDPRCMGQGITLCVDKSQKITRYVKDGQVIEWMDSNFGPEKGDPAFGRYSKTREGVFRVFYKKENSISTLYGTQLPYFMAFSGGEGFHYSSYFDQSDYADTSMGCIISNDRRKSAWFFANTPMKTKVVVYP